MSPPRNRLAGIDRVDPATNAMRSTNLTYCSAADVANGAATHCALEGQLRSADGPRTDVADVTTYAYRRSDDLSGCGTFAGPCHRKGDRWRTTNALGHVEEIATYDRDGRIARTRDANGTCTDYVYHARGWLLERHVRADASGAANAALDAITRYAYDDSGNVTYVYPAGGHGAYLKYDYDTAHRVRTVTDSLGNRIEYELDREGNRTRERIYGSDSVLKRDLRREYNALNRLVRIANAANDTVASFTATEADMTDGYDANGNPRRMSDGRGVVTDRQYDALNRLVTTIQDYGNAMAFAPVQTLNATTTLTYDAADRLTHVLDPDAVPTGYAYDGFDDVKTLTSNDGGNRTYVYDAAGNRTRETDARGVVTDTTYDALNRPVATLYPDTSFNVRRDYDQPDSVTGCVGSYPLGRLTQISDRDGITTYCYDRRGNIVKKTVETEWGSHATVYEYTRGDLLRTITYPNGGTVRYARDAMARVVAVFHRPTALDPETTVLSSVGYYPFGPVVSSP